MNIKFGLGTTEYGPGVEITLTRAEVAQAILDYVEAHGAAIKGPRTVMVGNKLCRRGRIYVDPSGEVRTLTQTLSGRGPVIEIENDVLVDSDA